MNAFSQAIDNSVNELTLTENGEYTYSTTGQKLLDFFFKMGQSRGQDIKKEFIAAFNENPTLATVALFCLRDVRGGIGERQQFRNLIKTLPVSIQLATVKFIPEYGRWDDLFDLYQNTKSVQVKKKILGLIVDGIKQGNGLLAKWMPRKGKLAVEFRKALGVSPKQYRKTIVALSKTVEQQMCSNNWDEIEFSHVPSVASRMYSKAFNKHVPEKYQGYLEKVTKGTAKINASSIFPYDVIRDFKYADTTESKRINEQWKAIPNLLGDDARVLPMVDTSGSMDVGIGGYGSSPTCLHVAISMGYYFASKQKGAFQNVLLNFDSQPKLYKLKGQSAVNDLKYINNMAWGMNTNIEAAFDLILSHAKKNKVPQGDMPTHLIIFSDMEFDQALGHYGWGRSKRQTNFQKMKEKFENSGYEFPVIVYWGIQSRNNNNPVQQHESGAILVSGFSQNIAEGLMENPGDVNPEKMMLKKLTGQRYQPVLKAVHTARI